MRRLVTQSLCIAVCAAGLVLAGLMLAAAPAAAQNAKQETGGVLGDFGRWLDKSFTAIGDRFKDAGQGIDRGVDNFNREAGDAAEATAGAAADAAGAVARLPNTRIVSGHQSCPLADNGAPDCAAAANRLCKAKGMKSGTSLEVTSARDCPARALIQREARAECHDVTFVTRAMCQ